MSSYFSNSQLAMVSYLRDDCLPMIVLENVSCEDINEHKRLCISVPPIISVLLTQTALID